MSFVAYVVSWSFICVCSAILISLFFKFVAFIREFTPLGNYMDRVRAERQEANYKELASFIVAEMAAQNLVREYVIIENGNEEGV